ncbi:unnamed protein product [Cyprideis torosa]|uniref:Uncharacterized protein n=1 Tax=Cyprideis torosa TaxID=163714 RepID=A0A7R8WDL0_9CRUS|nr:unnamed protein product [Cyprideis torosa]CAG0888453.1 unnamed protein product [Cyprideis torosa]
MRILEATKLAASEHPRGTVEETRKMLVSRIVQDSSPNVFEWEGTATENNLWPEPTTMTEEEIASKYMDLQIAFKTDKATLVARLERQQRQRGIAEANFHKELEDLRKGLDALKTLCRDEDTLRKFQNLETQLNVLQRASLRISAASELYGQLQQESKVSMATEIMIKHVEHITRNFDKDHTELEETKKILLENNLVVEEDPPRSRGATGAENTDAEKSGRSLSPQQQRIKALHVISAFRNQVSNAPAHKKSRLSGVLQSSNSKHRSASVNLGWKGSTVHGAAKRKQSDPQETGSRLQQVVPSTPVSLQTVSAPVEDIIPEDTTPDSFPPPTNGTSAIGTIRKHSSHRRRLSFIINPRWSSSSSKQENRERKVSDPIGYHQRHPPKPRSQSIPFTVKFPLLASGSYSEGEETLDSDSEDRADHHGIIQNFKRTVSSCGYQETPKRPGQCARGKAPGAKAPGAKAPWAKAPGAKVPGAKAPGAKAPGAKAPGAKASGAKAPWDKAATLRSNAFCVLASSKVGDVL